ncbi:O-acetyl-ADP-ribose deacetylase [Neptunicella marina]|uniref:O-acetyl-ADP-ribose deacetylase n=1 Tax=Neptunicella marina TaxID=2125989 RepID=A0A8J6M8K5_9ALTE|nr:O-acetyl-ADP-ribose deacetylase [Neptunicella marina]MBC3767811.1 O-acetyl-ADP-ribose deacetylase [Neptunicella marina]
MGMKLTLIQNDICQLHVDAIVNAANNTLLGGGGVDGAIHSSAGSELLALCKHLEGCKTGQAKITPAFDLPCQYIIHTVGPIYKDGRSGEPELLANCYKNALKLADKRKLKSVAFPAISCGTYGYPLDEACRISVEAITEISSSLVNVQKVILCAYTEKVHQAWLHALEQCQQH